MTARTCEKYGAWDDELIDDCPGCLNERNLASMDAKLDKLIGLLDDLFKADGRIG